MYVEYSAKERQDCVDEFITPFRLARAMAQLLKKSSLGNNPFLRILDAGANTGCISQALRVFFPVANITGVDIMHNIPLRRGVYTTYHMGTDFLTWQPHELFDGVVMNSPYSHPERDMAEKFIRHAFDVVKDGGHIIALTRANFPCAAGRIKGLFVEFPLHKFYWVERPSFYKHDPRTAQFGKGNTNRHDYAILHFIKGSSERLPPGWIMWK